MLVILMLGAAVALAVIPFVLRRRTPAPTEAFMDMRCRGCAQRVRYPARIAGSLGNCPRCFRLVALPGKQRECVG